MRAVFSSAGRKAFDPRGFFCYSESAGRRAGTQGGEDAEMRTAVVYYSLSGNTADTAERIAAALGAALVPLTPEKQYPQQGFRKFFWGGKSAVMAEKPPLRPYDFHAEDFDRVIIGFPVWAGNVAPPIRTFAQEQRTALQGKRIAAFACQSGAGAEKAFRKLKDCLGVDAFSAELILLDPKDKPAAENEKKLEAFCGAC